jgi:hypothetical protein
MKITDLIFYLCPVLEIFGLTKAQSTLLQFAYFVGKSTHYKEMIFGSL